MTQALLSLQPSDLRAVAAAIRSGRLAAPFLPSSVGRVLRDRGAVEMADALEDLAASGMQPAALAATLDLVGAALESRPSIDDVVDLVTTVPDATRVANRDTGVVVGELFRKACKSVLVAGYAVYQGKKVFQALAERMTELPHLNVRMFLDIQRGNGDTSSADELVRRFAHRFRTSEWPAGARIPQIHYDPRALSLDRNLRAALHAKCVVVDHTDVFISSANFTEAAQRRNIEVGLLVHSPLTACRVTEFFNNLVQAKLFLSVN